MERSDTRNEILAAGIEMVWLQGYKAAGLDAILKKAGVPKGSFYHYFESKEDFGLAIIDHFAEHYRDRLRGFLTDVKVQPLQRIRNYMLDGRRWFAETNHAKGCLIGNLSQELAGQNDRFRKRLEEVFTSWKDHFAACLREAQSVGQLAKKPSADVLAEFVLSGWEGALLRAKVTRSSQPITEFIEVLFSTTLKKP